MVNQGYSIAHLNEDVALDNLQPNSLDMSYSQSNSRVNDNDDGEL